MYRTIERPYNKIRIRGEKQTPSPTTTIKKKEDKHNTKIENIPRTNNTFIDRDPNYDKRVGHEGSRTTLRSSAFFILSAPPSKGYRSVIGVSDMRIPRPEVLSF